MLAFSRQWDVIACSALDPCCHLKIYIFVKLCISVQLYQEEVNLKVPSNQGKTFISASNVVIFLQHQVAKKVLQELKDHPESWTQVDSILECSNNHKTKVSHCIDQFSFFKNLI